MHKRYRLGPGCYVSFFSVRLLNMCTPRITFYLLWRACQRELAFHGSELACLGGDDECRLALFYAIRIFFSNEIFHFSRLSHQTGCIFRWAALSIESAPHSAASACSGRLFYKKCWSYGFEILNSFFSECSFLWLQHFFL